LHAHFAVGQYVEKALIERAWRNGFVDIKRLDAEFSRASTLARSRIAASYLAKYVSKGFRLANGLHRYEVAQGFAPHVRRFWALTKEDALEFCGVLIGEASFKVSMSAEWEGWHGPPTMWIQWDG